MTLVVNASVALNWVLLQPLTQTAMRIREAGQNLVAPTLLPIEAADGLRSQVRAGRLTQDEALDRLATIQAKGIDFLDPAHAADTALRLACLIDDNAYDCVYLALALELDCRLVTADSRFAERAAAAGFGGHVALLGRDL